jgi:hypothetical protein
MGNITDHFITPDKGYTVYYSHPEDHAFSPTNSILAADITRGVPIVSMYEKRTNLIGGRYSDCYGR